MRVKKFIELADFDSTIAITTTDECKTIKVLTTKNLIKRLNILK